MPKQSFSIFVSLLNYFKTNHCSKIKNGYLKAKIPNDSFYFIMSLEQCKLKKKGNKS